MESAQHPLDAIVGNSANGPQATREEPASSDSIETESKLQPYDPEDECSVMSKPAKALVSIPQTLNLSGLKSPAIILDDCLRVVWQNKMAVDLIWYRSRTANNGNPTPDIFDLLFDPQFQAAVDNWRQWVSFFMQHVVELVSADIFQRRLDRMSPRQKDIVASMNDRQKAEQWGKSVTSSCLRQIRTNGNIRFFDVTSIDFVEGRLLAFVPDAREASSVVDSNSHDLVRRYENVRRHPNPINMEFCVLSACLADALSFKTEMLPGEFCRLVNGLYTKCIGTIERHGGVFQRDSDQGFSAYILPIDEFDEGPSINAVKCALALRAQMAELSREWKIRKSWLHEIELNIGIHRSHEYMGILRSSLGDSLTNYGSALRVASDLAHVSPNGQIWATKALVNGLSIPTQSQLRFGIQRPGSHRFPVVIPNSFAAVGDLCRSSSLKESCFKDLESIAVTQIFDYQVAV